MSLQIQSSQQPTAPSSGRRTPQVYQNLATAGGGGPGAPSAPTSGVTPPAPTNGNKTSKLSLKASGKQSPAVVAAPAPQPDVIIIDPVLPKEILKGAAAASSNVVVSVAKLPAGGANGNSSANGKHDEAAKSAAPVTPKKDEVVEVKERKVKSSPRATPQKAAVAAESIPVEHVKTPESAGKKGAKDTTPTVVTPENKKKATAAAADNSLVAEKTLKGFTAEGDEMESLVVEPSEYEDSPMPPRTGGKSKLLKYGGAPPTRARISPFRVNAAANAAAAAAAAANVNLSTVSEGASTESNEASPAIPPADFNRPLRAISGRRSTRPLTDIQFTYRKSADLNDSSSSLNVTVGSEIHNDSLRTPGVSGSSRKRKNMTPESTSDALDVQEHTDSPKRTRLDFSGFLGIVASPVTMLKNRFSRVRLATSSTPVAKRSYDEEDLATCVTAEATTTTANISGGQPTAAGDAKMEVEPAETTPAAEGESGSKKDDETTPKDGQTDLPAAADASVADEAKEEDDDAVEVKDLTDKQQRRCVIM